MIEFSGSYEAVVGTVVPNTTIHVLSPCSNGEQVFCVLSVLGEKTGYCTTMRAPKREKAVLHESSSHNRQVGYKIKPH